MDVIVLLIGVIAVAGSLVGVSMIIYRRAWRPMGRLVLGVGLVCLALAVTGVFELADRDARNAGFANAADRHKAKQAGFADPSEWSAYKARQPKDEPAE